MIMSDKAGKTVDSILKGIALIESQLRRDINLSEIASESGYSYYHYSRVFQAMTGHSPYDYILRRKLSEAAKILVSTEKNIIDIAYDFGFKNPETFSRGFKRLFGIQPIQYRKSIKRHWHKTIMLEQLTKDHIKNRNYELDKQPEIVELKDLSVTGIISFVESRKLNCRYREISKEQFKNENDSHETRKYSRFYGVSFSYSETDDFFYLFGGDSSELPVTPRMLCKPMPDTKYACFTHAGETDNIRFTYDYIYGTWLPQSDFKLFHPMELESYSPDYSGDEKTENKIYVYIPLSL